MLTDANGGTATVILADVAASNGVIHAIDTVVMPNKVLTSYDINRCSATVFENNAQH
jgi:aminoglycoside N3'-acetyltransferase